MKIAINILKVLEIIITAIWGILLGIIAPLLFKSGDIIAQELAEHPVFTVWIVSSSVYLIGTLILMLNFYKISLCFHAAGLISSIYIYGVFQGLLEDINGRLAMLYMPLMLLTIFTLAIVIIANFDKINRILSKGKEKQYEAAPSLLGGEYKAESKKKGK
ncbi:MAG: hypothetical protein NC203_06695 [Firmicutes bacterium]|nr:hypothetical protein [[Eubacterium] siraeum]MCM1488035.1 hypothetical protein [Bacillota bacterium]